VRDRDHFPAGLVLDSHKQAPLGQPIVDLPAPPCVVLALDQGSGQAAEPVVVQGDRVAIGSTVARARDAGSTALHAPISGRVAAIETREAATASGHSTCIVIEGDGEERRDPAVCPLPDYLSLPPGELVGALRAAGIAGLGGAAFPTATKLEAARARGARRLVLNGAECEPWICCDDALIREQAADILLGAQVLMHALGADSCVVAIEDDKPQAIEAMRASVAATGASGVEVQVLPAIYPQGAERQLVTAVTGDEVPSRGLPAEVGVTCQNVATAAAIARWVRTGEPCLSRVVTVTGSGVTRPCNVRARIGTPLAALVTAAGGYRDTPLLLVAGGNMTGRALPSDEIGLTKAMNCVLVATHADLGSRIGAFERPCIRCGDCAAVCPAGLLPQQLHRAALADDEPSLRGLGIWDCIDCGCCDYVCPSQIPLAHRFREARNRLREREAAARKAAAARERHERRERRLEQAALAEQQAFDAARRRALGDGPAAKPDAPGGKS
jgi:electron transport complex protein RnfC